MKHKEYLNCITDLGFGKKLPDATYVYKDSLYKTNSKLKKLVKSIISKYEVSDVNLIKFYTREYKISLLYYPDFISDAHPSLSSSHTINMVNETISSRNYKSDNKPILHRKETFISSDHSMYKEFSELTKCEELLDLYKNPKTIGFEKNWNTLLAENNIEIVGHNIKQM